MAEAEEIAVKEWDKWDYDYKQIVAETHEIRRYIFWTDTGCRCTLTEYMQ